MTARDDIPGIIDHTLLKPAATTAQIDVLCAEAREHGFMSVCVHPVHVARAAVSLQGAEPIVCTVIGFPLGATTTATKVAETRHALADGAAEIDMVLDIGALKSGDLDRVREDVAAVAEETHLGGGLLKVILETCLLTDDEIVAACLACRDAGADFVKTSTGFSTGGATVEAVALMAATVGDTLGVKASGGVRCVADAEAMIAAGATRIGASSGVAIAHELRG